MRPPFSYRIRLPPGRQFAARASREAEGEAADPVAGLGQPLVGSGQAEPDMAGGGPAEGVAGQDADRLVGQQPACERSAAEPGAADVEHHEHAAFRSRAGEAGQPGQAAADGVAPAAIPFAHHARRRAVPGQSATVAASWMNGGEP